MKKVKKCIIPAAWLWTRFLPATKALPKEMFPIIDKPVMQYLVEEAVSAWCEDIIIITGRNKRAIEDHFDSNYELEEALKRDNKLESLEKVRGVSNLANIYYVRQPYPRWDGDALLRAKNFIGDEPFLVLFGDDIIVGEKSASSKLIEAYEQKNAPIISVEKVKQEEVSTYGIVESKNYEDAIIKVSKILEKPVYWTTNSRLGVIGKYVLTPNIFDYLEQVKESKKTWEIRLADAFALMLQERDIFALDTKWLRFDTGSKLGFLKATLYYAWERPELREEIKKFIQNLE